MIEGIEPAKPFIDICHIPARKNFLAPIPFVFDLIEGLSQFLFEFFFECGAIGRWRTSFDSALNDTIGKTIEARGNVNSIKNRKPNGRLEISEVDHRRSAVKANADVPITDLACMTGGAGEAKLSGIRLAGSRLDAAFQLCKAHR